MSSCCVGCGCYRNSQRAGAHWTRDCGPNATCVKLDAIKKGGAAGGRSEPQLSIKLRQSVRKSAQRDRHANAEFRRLEDNENGARPVFIFVTRSSLATTSATQPTGPHLRNGACPTSTLSIFSPRPVGNRTPERRHHAQNARLTIIRSKENHRKRDIRPVFRLHTLHKSAFFLLRARWLAAAKLPGAVGRFNWLELSSGPAALAGMAACQSSTIAATAR